MPVWIWKISKTTVSNTNMSTKLTINEKMMAKVLKRFHHVFSATISDVLPRWRSVRNRSQACSSYIVAGSLVKPETNFKLVVSAFECRRICSDTRQCYASGLLSCKGNFLLCVE